MLTETIQALHEKAKKTAENYLYLEKELLEIIIQIDKKKVFYRLGYRSLFAYVTEALKLSPATAYSFIRVARKSHEIPELKKEVMNGKLSISKAQKMTQVLTKENHRKWFGLAQKVTHRKLEREVALASPRQSVIEKAFYVHPTEPVIEKAQLKTRVARVALQVGVSENLMFRLRRVQDIESRKQKKDLSLEDVLEALVEVYLSRQDPLRKARRQKIRGKLQDSVKVSQPYQRERERKNEIKPRQSNMSESVKNSSWEEFLPMVRQEAQKYRQQKKSQRKSLPASVIHRVYLKDEGRCTHYDVKGRRCASRRFLEIHHKKPVSQGGDDSINNLKLLCSGHHKAYHASSFV